MKGDKLVELQGLRCIAIISVLLFHIWPEFFKNGFLGVDIFFVVSGYIMAMIRLSPNNKSLKESFFKTSFKFYYRRIYRILPLYLITIFVTCLIVPAISFTAFYYNFLNQVKSALMFYVNFSMLFESHNYFNNGLSFYWFKHYWSLCVEMQFYAIVPFLFYISKKLSVSVNLFIFWSSLIGASGFLIFYKLFNAGDSSVFFIFTMLPTRFYEFGGGFMAFHAQQFIDLYFNDRKILLIIKKYIYCSFTTNILSLILISITLFPKNIDVIYAFPSIVFITALLILSIGRKAKQNNELKYSVLGNDFAIFIGDASYSLYICHWIIVTLMKAIYDDNQQSRQLMLVACFFIGIFVHLFIEKPIIKAKMKPEEFFPWVVIAYLAIGFITFSNNSVKTPSSFAKDIYLNKSMIIANKTEWQKFAKVIYPEISAEIGVYANQKGCHHYTQSEFAESYQAELQGASVGTEIKGTGNLSVLIIGNSHAECILPGIELALKGIYSELNLFVTGGVTPFEGFKFSRVWFLLKEAVKHYKPDIIYFVFKYQEDFDDTPIEPIESDPQTLKEIEERHTVSTRRWKAIKCKNCIFMNMLQAYCKNGWCSPIDETLKVPLLNDDNHITIFGSYLLTPYFKKLLTLMYSILKTFL